MADKKKTPNIKETENFIEIWNLNGGLLSQAQVSRMLDVKTSHITKNWKSLELKKLNVNGKIYISFNSAYKTYLERKKASEDKKTCTPTEPPPENQ